MPSATDNDSADGMPITICSATIWSLLSQPQCSPRASRWQLLTPSAYECGRIPLLCLKHPEDAVIPSSIKHLQQLAVTVSKTQVYQACMRGVMSCPVSAPCCWFVVSLPEKLAKTNFIVSALCCLLDILYISHKKKLSLGKYTLHIMVIYTLFMYI